MKPKIISAITGQFSACVTLSIDLGGEILRVEKMGYDDGESTISNWRCLTQKDNDLLNGLTEELQDEITGLINDYPVALVQGSTEEYED